MTQTWDPTYDDKLRALRRLKLSPSTLEKEGTVTSPTSASSNAIVASSPCNAGDDANEVLVVTEDDQDPLSKLDLFNHLLLLLF